MAVIEEKSKGGSIKKTLFTIFVILISIPLIIVGIMYLSNRGFRDSTNNFLSKQLPGKTGQYFETFPTVRDEREMKENIAKYYLSLEEDRAVDKLLIIRGETSLLTNKNRDLHEELISFMYRENRTKAKNIEKKLNEILMNSKFEKDPYIRILDEVEKQNNEKIENMQKYYTSLITVEAVQEIERTHASNEITLDELSIVFERFKPDQAAKYLFYMDSELEAQIRFKLSKEALRSIEKKLEELENNQIKTLELASIYENKSTDEAVVEIGNTNKYNIEQLALIYKNLSLNKSSKILSNVDDNDFMLTLFNEINHYEKLNKERPTTSAIIMNGVTIYKDYKEKVDELVDVYQKADQEELTKMIETMLKRNEIYKKHVLKESEQIVFTEEQLVIDVLGRLKPNKVASILDELEEGDRISLSKKILRQEN